MHITRDLRDVALVALGYSHGGGLLALGNAGAGRFSLDVCRARDTAVLHADRRAALHSLVVALLGEVRGQQALHEALVAALLLTVQSNSNLNSLRGRMSRAVASTVPSIRRRADAHPKAALLLPLRTPLRRRH